MQSLGPVAIMTHSNNTPIIFSFCVGMLSYVVAGCPQITYPLPQECSHALSSSGPHPNCSSINLLQERPVCELQSIEDIVALRRNVFMAGMQLVCFAEATCTEMIISEIVSRRHCLQMRCNFCFYLDPTTGKQACAGLVVYIFEYLNKHCISLFAFIIQYCNH